MEEKGFFKRLFEKIREWFLHLLRILFPQDILDEIRQRAGNRDEGNAAGGSGADTVDSGLSDMERRQMMASPVTRLHLRFLGRVQGVGFRYQAMYAARNFNLTGWVKNMPDGSVEMEVQGPEEAIDYMLLQLQTGRWIRIEHIEKKKLPLVREERGFQVRGY